MNGVIRYYRLFNLLSLDVALGAVVGALFFSKIYQVKVSYPSLILLGLSVWLIYTVDRLLDVRDLKVEAASERHRFHQRNQKKLKFVLAIIMVIAVVLIFFVPGKIIVRGLLLSGVVSIYILFREKFHVLKEFFVATLYTIGVLLPAWPTYSLSLIQGLPIFLFFLMALLNLIIFSRYEKENDLKDRHNSMATLVSENVIRYVLDGLFAVTCSISFYFFLQPAFHFMSVVFIAMTVVLLLIFQFKSFFGYAEYYRLAGDAIFLFPVFYLLT